MRFMDFIAKVLLAIWYCVVWSFALAICGIVTLYDGLRYGVWHEETWETMPDRLQESWAAVEEAKFS